MHWVIWMKVCISVYLCIEGFFYTLFWNFQSTFRMLCCRASDVTLTIDRTGKVRRASRLLDPSYYFSSHKIALPLSIYFSFSILLSMLPSIDALVVFYSRALLRRLYILMSAIDPFLMQASKYIYIYFFICMLCGYVWIESLRHEDFTCSII